MTDFICEVDRPRYRSACEGLDFYAEHEGKRYCVLHYPGEDKYDDFKEVIESKLKLDQKDYDFGGTVFPEGTSDFSMRQFNADVDFSGAVFVGKADFFSTYFSGETTVFAEAEFSGERTDFSQAEFTGELTSFSNAEFVSAETTFIYAGFFSKRVEFIEATFRERVAFRGLGANLVFQIPSVAWFHNSKIDKPEQFTFNNVRLHPGWFLNVDVRKVNFTDVKWYGMPGGFGGTLDEEIRALTDQYVESAHTLLAQVCRRLSANADENREYPLANEFHYWSMEALRKLGWRSLGLIGTLYWALSGYGVRAARAFWVLIGIWAVFTTLYALVDPSEFKDFGQGFRYFWQAAVYSLLALARLNPEPNPEEPGLFQFLVGLEGILGPLQIALLALASRRQVMR
jgi:hypothetical protein